jgi:hypothetical protein
MEGRRLRGERQQRWNFNGIGYERWKRGRGGDGVQPFLEGKRGRRRSGSTVPKVDDITKSGAIVGEGEGDDWRVEVKDDQRKLGRWVKLLNRSAKKICLGVWDGPKR